MITDEGRAVALSATERLNRTVFARPGLTPDQLEQVVELLTDLRHDAGDF